MNAVPETPVDESQAVVEKAYRVDVSQVIAALETDAENGLSDSEAAARLKRFGPNELRGEAAVPAWRRFLAQFQDTLVILLLVATAISAGLWIIEQDTAAPYEAIAILAVVLLNAAMGFLQESRAQAAVSALQEMAADQAPVVRGGVQKIISSADIVPGDLLLIEEGDTIPADARLIETVALKVSEAALTGESEPIEKHADVIPNEVALGDRHNMVFSGTSATYGHGRAVVTATGMATQMGRIADLLRETEDETTPLQIELDRVGKLLGMIVIGIAVVMIATIILVENVTGLSGIVDVLILGVALAVAAVPEGLPAVVTAVLALGVQRMARRNAIVRHLSAVETLGSARVIASDKTGTLTRNEMTVRAVVTASGRVDISGTGYAPVGEVLVDGDTPPDGALREEVMMALTAAERANNAELQEDDGSWIVQGDPTEGALIVAARKAGLDADELDGRFPRVGEVPFSSERKLMSTVHSIADEPGRLRIFTKGAPDVLLPRCSHELVDGVERPLTHDRRLEIVETNERLAGEALRTLAVATKVIPGESLDGHEPGAELEQDLVFLGLIGMIDPPREEVRDAVRRAKSAGVRPIMITGDHPATALVIARELGIAEEERVAVGRELETLSDEELDELVLTTSIYARVNPEHKLRIVDALQRHGDVVAMTGDGVNDAPALKSADIGIAMGITGTDVSKKASDMILADDNFATIVAAVEEGRVIFGNIRKFLRYLLSSNIGEVMTMFFGVLLAGVIGLDVGGGAVVLPLLATQILWINLVTDGAPALALGLDPANADVMTHPPRPKDEGVLTAEMWRGIFFVGAVMAMGTLAVLDASLPGGLIEGSGDITYGQTMAFTTLMLFQVFNVFNARSDDRSAFLDLFTNGWLWGAVGLSVALQVAVVYVPILQRAFGTVSLSGGDWIICTAVASSVLWLREIVKAVKR